MKKIVKIVSSSILICFAYAGTALGGQVTIDPAGYTGQWAVNYGPARVGPAIVDLGSVDPTTGSHVISISGAELFFNIDADGTVVVKNSGAATGSIGKLTFNTTTIKVDPMYFSGYWRVTVGATPDLSGVQFVTLVPGLRFYNLEVGATGGFFFHLASDGTVTVPNELAASGGVKKLTLNNTERFLQ